jgi:hypothetical protein
MRLGSMMLILPLAAFSPAGAQEAAMRVTTDSSAYCQELALRFMRERVAAPAEVKLMAEDGVRLCQNGHPRAGIAKLRRALRAVQPAGG